MLTNKLRSALIERPEFLLALSLSAPHSPEEISRNRVILDFEDDEVAVRVGRPNLRARPLRLAATKQTIAAAILMHHVLSERGPDYALSIIERAEHFGDIAAHHDSDMPPESSLSLEPSVPISGVHTPDFFYQFLDVSSVDFEVASKKTLEAFEFLEGEDLAIDPAFMPEMMVLLGLIPMHFSVRTPRGERAYRKIKVNAPLWSLDVVRGAKNGRPFTDVEFKFRGIETVRRALSAMARQYLESEERIRQRKGQAVLKRKGQPELDAE